MSAQTIFTVGHSDHSIAKFISLLKKSAIDAVIDVRSFPYSRRFLHFDKPELKATLSDVQTLYFFLGSKLGGRPRSDKLYKGGVADYGAMAQTDTFKDAIDQVLRASKRHRVALMCSERDPLDCHRCLLIGRRLAELGHSVAHILASGAVETQDETERRLVHLEGFRGDDLFISPGDRINLAYQRRANKVAFHQPAQADVRRVASG